ncbi:SdpI family protein [Aquimarina sp. W85]|uniref:SdpI family protein n=1 Tax=Aquimarina rhodophyticola TaxID=3342246 RepID=UPI00367026FD
MNIIAILLVIISVLIIALPVYFLYKPAKKINGLYGYRTPRSMENQKNWDAAQEYFPRMLLKLSILTIAAMVLLYLLFSMLIALFIGLGIWVICLFSTIFLTEIYLKAKEKEFK